MSWRSYRGLHVEEREQRRLKEKYSATSDILAYQICPRQYGFFKIRKYQPAHLVQIWYGTIIHQVLDKLHLHYEGLLDPSTRGQIPTDNDVERYFSEVENSLLLMSGIRPITPSIRNTALRVLKIFNRIEAQTLYPQVIDTECEFSSDRGDYILTGKVDVLRDISIHGEVPEGFDPVEIWDYKGTRYPNTQTETGRRKFERYVFQMLVYAELYREKYGSYPLKGVLYFMNELDTNPEPNTRPPQAIYEIDFRDPYNLRRIHDAISNFDYTVRRIENDKERDRWDPPPYDRRPDDETCNICDLRWSCPLWRGRNKYPMRYP